MNLMIDKLPTKIIKEFLVESQILFFAKNCVYRSLHNIIFHPDKAAIDFYSVSDPFESDAF